MKRGAMMSDNDQTSDQPEATYTLVCDGNGIHQEFDEEAGNKAAAEETLRKRAAQAGWSQSDCKMK
jgi:hypothetical protein